MENERPLIELDAWERDIMLTDICRMKPRVDAYARKTDEMVKDLTELLEIGFPEYHIRAYKPAFGYKLKELFYEGVQGELARITVRKGFFGKKLMKLDILSHHKGQDAHAEYYGDLNYSTEDFHDEKLARFAEDFFKDQELYLSAEIL